MKEPSAETKDLFLKVFMKLTKGERFSYDLGEQEAMGYPDEMPL